MTQQTMGIYGAYVDKPEITAEKPNPILDRCWAPWISAAGGALGILGAREVVKGRYGRAAFYAGASALCDFADGPEARRFAKRNPEAGRARKFRGMWEDQIWDRVRNIALGTAVMTVPEIPTRAKVIVGAMVAKETVTGVIGAKTLGDHWIEHEDGSWPAPIPPADRGKESMWWVGTGLSGIMLGAKLQKTNPELAKKMSDTATGLCAIGLMRGLQTVREYKDVMNEMSCLTPEELMDYSHTYTPHIGGRIVQLRETISSTSEAMRSEAASMAIPYVPA